MTKIQDALVDSNPWWKKSVAFLYKERTIYSKLQKYMPLPQIIALTGLRRVGKTTLMFKFIQDLLEKGVPAQNIMYFSFDNFSTIELTELIKEYKLLLSENDSEEKLFLFFDEIQKLSNWENQIKAVYDAGKSKIKIVLSGSESLFIRRKSKENLAGRLFSFTVQQLSFKEFLLFKEVQFIPTKLYSNELSILFEDFIKTQGFPELVHISDKEIIKKYIQEGIIEKILYKDLPNLFLIKDAGIIESLLRIFSEEPGQLINLDRLAQQLHVSRQTLSQYMCYLEDAFLLRKLYNYSTNKKKTERKLKKIYTTLLSPELTFKEDDFSRSKVFEWLVINQTRPTFFWRDQYKNEVDMVLHKPKVIPCEIKYGKIDLAGLRAFSKTFNIHKGIIISRNQKDQIPDKTVSIIPAHMFLLDEKYSTLLE